jgi:hypothetical protein
MIVPEVEGVVFTDTTPNSFGKHKGGLKYTPLCVPVNQNNRLAEAVS